MIASSLRAVAVPVALVLAVAACSSPGSSSAWSFGPSLAPAAPSGSAAASAVPPASAAPSVAPSSAPSAAASAGGSAPPAGEVTNLTIGTKTGDELEFDPDEVSVPAGAQVKLTFENRASLPHNLTFTAPMTVATAPSVAPGESATLEFAAPAPGDHQFSCTIHPTMQGTLTVDPAG